MASGRIRTRERRRARGGRSHTAEIRPLHRLADLLDIDADRSVLRVADEEVDEVLGAQNPHSLDQSLALQRDYHSVLARQVLERLPQEIEGVKMPERVSRSRGRDRLLPSTTLGPP